MNVDTHEKPPRAVIHLAILGALLTGLNSIIATLALGVFQGPIVAFTTPFVFCLGKLMYPRLPGATVIYLPVVIVSIFTLNLGPPGHYKVAFLIGAIFYDAICYVLRVGGRKRLKVDVWKLVIANIFYPMGLLFGALLAISFFMVELPFISKSWIAAAILLVVFGVIGSIATLICHRAYYTWLHKEMQS